ncbi:hypothetical protein GCM10011506_25190 [Marivirga lumbricoides]|uniref:Glyceraldehyde 3-phosphate dehydrogenase NAD(P) binding domain-containing protein n=2 Tax=Marivirga lumbricoides TaxID=1046115 RepID=A0ABQ1MDJ2_9BACT|nr:hypothetical protein GCM10011506_25190 [Marivirga lumbricoides]
MLHAERDFLTLQRNFLTFNYLTMKNVAINGLGRIGRSAIKVILENDDLNLVALNDPNPPQNLALMLQCESSDGNYHRKVEQKEGALVIDGKEYPIYNVKKQDDLPWKELNIDLVFDCSESYSIRQKLENHYKAGAKRVMSWYDNEAGYVSQLVKKAKSAFSAKPSL